MYGRLPVKRKPPAALSQLHRWSGAVAFVATLPVAYHCLWSLGFSTFDTRTALHSLIGAWATAAIWYFAQSGVPLR